MIGYIYKTTNLLNGKLYIGQKHSTKFIPSYLGSGREIRNAVKLYGKKNFKVELIEEILDIDQMDDREIYWIQFYHSTDRAIGYNISSGGNVNRTFKGEHNPMWGKHHTEAAIQKIKQRVFSKETLQRMSVAKKGKYLGKNNPHAISVLQIAPDGTVVQQFDTYRQAAQELSKINGKKWENIETGIKDVCAGRQRSAYGYLWQKVD